ncbi:MAG: hypothetical protein GF418_00175 [Chitinivibrionales bacterium]|nr:hypothetical protein [Chitinivibrionales bacterium]MBD3394015.1 hypothetical protein [Chitinivibrionales bacterium]
MNPPFLCIPPLLLTAFLLLPARAIEPQHPKYDYATFTVEHLMACGNDTPGFGAEKKFQAWWMFVSFPGLAVFGRDIYLAAEVDGMDRVWSYQGERLNRTPATRIGLFSGVSIFKRDKHRGTFFVGTGVASDFVSLHRDAAYVHLIYDHRFTISDRLSAGLGLLVMHNFDRWQRDPPVNLLPSLRWDISRTTFLRIAWDNLTIRQYVHGRVALVGELRYDFSFFRLDHNTTVEFETVAAGGGVDIWIAGDLYVRARYKELVYKNELVERDLDVLVDDTGMRGRAVKVLLVYAR